MSKPAEPLRQKMARLTRKMPSGCIEYIGALSSGYGSIYVEELGKSRGAHRVAWYLAKGVWPQGVVCHSCDNPRCVNIEHLWIGSQADNIHDAVEKGRFTGRPRKLSAAETRSARQMRRDKATLGQIADSLGVAEHLVHYAVRDVPGNSRGRPRENVSPRQLELLDKLVFRRTPMTEISKATGIAYHRVRELCAE